MSFFTDKVVIVTGGTEGIGKALVEKLLEDGAKVATCGRNFDKLYQMQLKYSDYPFMTHKADVSFEQDCRRLIELTIKTYGKIDILINNAGISMRALFEETDMDTLRNVMDVNFWGAVYCTKYALPYLLASKGTIVGVSSIAGYRGLPGRSGYSASKYALNGWLESIRTELKHKDVNVIWVCPGFTASNIRNVALNKDAKPEAESLMDEGNMMTAEQCASYILRSIIKKKRNLILTFQGKEAVWMNRLFPSWTDKLIHKFYFKNGVLTK
ncbi:SDR family oxidoreductase [Rhizosphaericola mali]|uniref:SDR family oxidoreductase n=1 Tax=Rhizosphaericola mali TaxID=2545455 RepID=A0A5P2G0B0_9BACT|nr:SDR family oxidoreductase [Rhizosphaericola mali]QES89234.1 SDR family oxidoreductase [Rhizosphaericola mali]